MKLNCPMAVCYGLVLMLALESVQAQGNSSKAEAAALIPENLKIEGDLTPFLPEIKLALKRKDEASTTLLVRTLTVLFKARANERYLCGNTSFATNSAVDILSYPRVLFDAVLDELLSRDDKPVSTLMKQLLLSENLDEGDKRRIWDGLKRMSGIDSPVVLQATDPSQNRRYILRMDTDSKSEVEVKKGDTLLRIAKRSYPELSVWSGVDIISFMNGLDSDDLIDVGSKLKIYRYRIIRNESVDQPGAGAKKTGL